MRARRGVPATWWLAGCIALGSITLSGCTTGADNSTHDVLLGARANSGTATLRYQIEHRTPVTVPAAAAGTSASTSVDLRLRAGTHVAIVGSADSITSPDITCTVAVDGIVRSTTTTPQPADALLDNPLACHTEAYVLHRPYGFNRVLEIAAFVLCLLIVSTAIAALIVPRRRSH